jgi:hypothetical protein
VDIVANIPATNSISYSATLQMLKIDWIKSIPPLKDRVLKSNQFFLDEAP